MLYYIRQCLDLWESFGRGLVCVNEGEMAYRANFR